MELHCSKVPKINFGLSWRTYIVRKYFLNKVSNGSKPRFIFSVDIPHMKPFIVSVWYGHGKPEPANDFLSSFVNGVNELLSNGISVNGHTLKIKVRCFICDTPARSLVKGMRCYINFKHIFKQFNISL